MTDREQALESMRLAHAALKDASELLGNNRAAGDPLASEMARQAFRHLTQAQAWTGSAIEALEEAP